MTRLATLIFDHAHPIIFDQLLIVINLHQHTKNQLFNLLIPQIESILESHHMTGHIHF